MNKICCKKKDAKGAPAKPALQRLHLKKKKKK